MPAAWVSAPLILAVVLIFSGVLKVRDIASTMVAMQSLQVPNLVPKRLTATVLPWVEIALGVLLLALPAPWAAIPALGVLVLMVIYLVLIVAAARGPEPADCNCFGGSTPSRVTWRTVVRNLILVALAVIALVGAWRTGVPATALGLGSDWLWVVALAVTALLVWTIVGPIQPDSGEQSGTELEVDEAAQADYLRTPIPFGMLQQPDTTTVTLRDLAQTKARLLLFSSTTCRACITVNEKVPSWKKLMPQIGVHLVFLNPDSLNSDVLTNEMREEAFIDYERSNSKLFGMHGTPWAVLLGADGLLAGGPVQGNKTVIRFVEDIQAELAATD